MSFFVTLINELPTYAVTILAVLGGLNMIASAIVAITPSQKDDAILEKVVAFVERFSFILKKPSK